MQRLARQSHPLTDEANLLLAYRALQAGLTDEATTWAHRIGKRNSEASALLALIAYHKNDPAKALHHLDHCHLQTFGLAALRGVCRAELGHSEEVDLALLVDSLPPQLEALLAEEFGSAPAIAVAEPADYQQSIQGFPGLLS